MSVTRKSHEDRMFQISIKIKQTLNLRHLSRTKFAALMGVQPSIITRWLNGPHNFTTDTLFKIEEVLDISLTDLTI